MVVTQIDFGICFTWLVIQIWLQYLAINFKCDTILWILDFYCSIWIHIFLQQMDHSTLTLTSLEINEDENYKTTLFDQFQMFSEKFFCHEKIWSLPEFSNASFLNSASSFNCNLRTLLVLSVKKCIFINEKIVILHFKSY